MNGDTRLSAVLDQNTDILDVHNRTKSAEFCQVEVSSASKSHATADNTTKNCHHARYASAKTTHEHAGIPYLIFGTLEVFNFGQKR